MEALERRDRNCGTEVMRREGLWRESAVKERENGFWVSGEVPPLPAYVLGGGYYFLLTSIGYVYIYGSRERIRPDI